jgi:hypothetical protein
MGLKKFLKKAYNYDYAQYAKPIAKAVGISAAKQLANPKASPEIQKTTDSKGLGGEGSNNAISNRNLLGRTDGEQFRADNITRRVGGKPAADRIMDPYNRAAGLINRGLNSQVEPAKQLDVPTDMSDAQRLALARSAGDMSQYLGVGLNDKGVDFDTANQNRLQELYSSRNQINPYEALSRQYTDANTAALAQLQGQQQSALDASNNSALAQAQAQQSLAAMAMGQDRGAAKRAMLGNQEEIQANTQDAQQYMNAQFANAQQAQQQQYQSDMSKLALNQALYGTNLGQQQQQGFEGLYSAADQGVLNDLLARQQVSGMRADNALGMYGNLTQEDITKATNPKFYSNKKAALIQAGGNILGSLAATSGGGK